MKEYYGTYKMGNGIIFDVYKEGDKYIDDNNQEIDEEELKGYVRLGKNIEGHKETVRYIVEERRFNGSLFVGTLEECREFIKTELRARNQKDGYDEYWHNVDVVIIKETTISEVYEAYL